MIFFFMMDKGQVAEGMQKKNFCVLTYFLSYLFIRFLFFLLTYR
jgi:TM2 domain-containing membrane protein YozV